MIVALSNFYNITFLNKGKKTDMFMCCLEEILF